MHAKGIVGGACIGYRWARRAENRDLPQVRVYGRLAPGISAEQARAELATLARGLDEQHPRETEPRQFGVGAATTTSTSFSSSPGASAVDSIVGSGSSAATATAGTSNDASSGAAARAVAGFQRSS